MDSDSYEVIVIGAGISGIGASKTLTQHHIPHLLIESRDRIGGRICSQEFDGVKVELGASFVHQPKKQNNLISQFVQEVNCGKIPGKFGSTSYYYQNEGLMKNKHILKAQDLHSQMQQEIDSYFKTSNEDTSLQTVARDFFKRRVSGQSEQVRNVYESLNTYSGNVEGVETSQLSLKDYQGDQSQTKEDFMPEGGFSKIISSLFDLCRPTLKLGEKVVKIDYSNQMVEVTTDKQRYRCKKVIASLPIGILQAGKVQFIPELPQNYRKNIDNIGNGNLNKIYVSFDKPFWGNRKGYINFVTKTKNNRYPIAFISPEKNKHMLCFFVSANPYLELCQWKDRDIQQDLQNFIRKFKFMKEDVKIRAFKMTRWSCQESTLGSYSYVKVGHNLQEISNVLRRPIDEKVWLVGEHLHPQLNACAHSAYETGVWAAKEVSEHMQGQ